MRERIVIQMALVIQTLCAFFFVSDIAVSVLGIRTRPIPWQTREFLEIGASLGLVLGIVLGALALRRTQRRIVKVNEQLRVASGAFMELMEERFDEWLLTPAERDVAMFVLKGLSTQEIANLRSTSEGTIKAQTNAIYRKAEVTGRPQLLSQFIDDLIDVPLV